MKNIVVGILAHVDAGKTTLSESMLYVSGNIKKQGRVDNQDAFLDTYELERKRGITIFSKQALLKLPGLQITLLDTPGHVDFSAEMERTLQVLDYAILVVSGADGVQGHTKTLWRLLKKYQIPVFLFINKMDQVGTEEAVCMEELRKSLSDACVNFMDTEDEAWRENVSMCDERVLDHYLDTAEIDTGEVVRLIAQRKLFPCYFGSALKSEGVEEFLEALKRYTRVQEYPDEFQARVFKIARDGQGNRLTFLKVTGGSLKVKAMLPGLDEKVNQIRLYSGEKYESIPEAGAGSVCAVTGLSATRAGMGLGDAEGSMLPVLFPVLTYELICPSDCDARQLLPKLRILEEEIPELSVVWNEKLQEILVKVMGEVQIEILKSLILERFGVATEFGAGHIVYRETIADSVEGVGHFEPLRHYAEVHLLLEPLAEGSGLEFFTDCSEEVLDKNWQRLVLTHLKEREHRGVLTGSSITDMRITLIAGRAHQKHTEGGDFRQATYRALRQGLMQAKGILLEPFYEFRLEIPEEAVGRAMMDIDRMYAKTSPPEILDKMAVLTGRAPVATMCHYAKDVLAYTRGHGKLFCNPDGYSPCHNEAEVVEEIAYDPTADIPNTPDSVFCAHGAGFVVPWQEVFSHMHVESPFASGAGNAKEEVSPRTPVAPVEEWIDTEEIDAILQKTFYANKKEGAHTKKWTKPVKTAYMPPVTRTVRQENIREEFLLVDGYNVIFAWEDLNALAAENIDGARGKLMDILCNYQGIKKCNLIVVFDAYRVQGHQTEIFDYHNIHVVFTKEAETADQYIEKFAHENGRKHHVTVATSDGLEQIIIRGAGCRLVSSRELKKEIADAVAAMNENYVNQKAKQTSAYKKAYLLDDLSEEIKSQIQGTKESEDK